MTPPTTTRGQSEVLSVIILTGIIVVSVALTLSLGLGAFGTTQDQYGHAVAENEFSSLAGTTEDVAFSSVSQRSVDLELARDQTQGQTYIRPSSGYITVRVGGAAVYSEDFGAVVYIPANVDGGGASVGLQGGGVFQRTPSGTAVVNEPPMTSEDLSKRTLTIPILHVRGDGQLQSGATISQRSLSDRYPAKEVAASDTVEITIKSRYYRGWGTVLNESLNIPEDQISYNDNTETVTATVGAGNELFLHLRTYDLKYSERR
jgi:hypothetical protein